MNNNDVFLSRDKQICPFLLIQSEITFLGVIKSGPYIYFQFTPSDICKDLVNKFLSHRAPLAQPKDLLDAVESYRDRVFEMKDKDKIWNKES